MITGVETIWSARGRPFGWVLVRILAGDGSIGLGDASDSQAPRTTVGAIHELLAPRVLGRDAAEPPTDAETWTFGAGSLRLPFEGLPLRTAASAVEMALWDLAARVRGAPLFQLLGASAGPHRIPLYANLNRGLSDDTPSGLARAARAAVDEGFTQMKCAPFSGVRPDHAPRELLAKAYRRIEAARAAVGDAALLVDAHGRLNERNVREAAAALEANGVAWFEEPARFQEDPDTLRAAASATTIPIAAGELLSAERYADLIAHGATSVVMTDVKHNGGVASTRRVAELCARSGRSLSLHNPTGPVSTLISAHVCAAVGPTAPLEYATHPDRSREATRLFGAPERIEDGVLILDDAPGIGIELRDHAPDASERTAL